MAQLLSTNVSGTLAVTQNTTVSGNLIVSGYNVLNEIFQADNLARVSANSGSVQSAVSLNFVNTATVQVSVTSGDAGIADIAFTSSGSSGVTSVDTGLGLTGGPITLTGTISANIATTTEQGITKLIDSVTSTDTANAATGAAVKVAFDQATGAYDKANAAHTTAVAAYGQANAALNRVQVSANNGSIQSNVAINFINTSSIIVSVGPGSTGNADVTFNSHISNGSITSAATITPLRTGPHNHYAVTALATAATIEPPAVNTGKDGDRLTLRIEDNGTGRGLTWNTDAGAYRAIGVTLPTTTVATKVLYIGSIYNSTDNFWDVVAYVVQA